MFLRSRTPKIHTGIRQTTFPFRSRTSSSLFTVYGLDCSFWVQTLFDCQYSIPTYFISGARQTIFSLPFPNLLFPLHGTSPGAPSLSPPSFSLHAAPHMHALLKTWGHFLAWSHSLDSGVIHLTRVTGSRGPVIAGNLSRQPTLLPL